MKPPERWEIMHVRLEERLKPLEIPERTAGAYLMFWWHATPLGHVLVRGGEFPLTAAGVQNRAAQAIAPALMAHIFGQRSRAHASNNVERTDHVPAPFESLVQLDRPLGRLPRLDVGSTPGPRISIIVCTRRRPDQLRACLESLQKLDPAPAEIIVVDNAPGVDVTHDVVGAFKQVTYVEEPARGLSRARNTGIRHASGEIIAFTDDDVRVHPQWLLGVRAALIREGVLGMTGLVLPAELETDAQMRFESTMGFNRGYQSRLFDSAYFQHWLGRAVPVWDIGAGANMAFHRAVFEKVGLFDERLGAGASGCSEDSELWYRMLAAGMTIAYEPRAVVWHSHRVSDDALRSQMRQYMRGHVVALLVQCKRHRHPGNLRRAVISLSLYFSRKLRRTRRLADLLLLLAGVSGYLWGFLTYARLRTSSHPTRASVAVAAILLLSTATLT